MNSFFAALQRFGIGRLAVLLGVGGGGAALLITILINLAAPPMGLLYSNLDLREAGSITQALDQANIKYQVQGDGSTIMVPRDKVATARLMLAGKGLPTANSVGYEIFDSQNALGQTDFIQQLNMKRATEGELARTIRALDGVTFARVHLVLPERQLFQDATDQASASVTIGVGAREPSTDQVRAVQNLVSGAVPNLKPERVVVIDQHGKTLSAESDGARRQGGRGRQGRDRGRHPRPGEEPGRGRRRRRQGARAGQRRRRHEPGHHPVGEVRPRRPGGALRADQRDQRQG